jgi:hypothetical protein
VRCQAFLEDSEERAVRCTAPIPALAPVIRTVLPSNLDALKIDIGRMKDGYTAFPFLDGFDNKFLI